MANPSEIVTGAGTEVLRRYYASTQSAAWVVMINGVAGHIYSLLSLTIAETSNTPEDIGLRIMIDGSTECTIIEAGGEVLPAKGTFIWNDKLVLTGTDQLEVYVSTGDMDIYCSYIDQDWN